jgi:voltage-gated potassium channel
MYKIFIKKNRFLLLLAAAFLYLVLPAFFSKSFFFEIVMLVAMSFLFIQSLFAVFDNTRHLVTAFSIGLVILLLSWADYFGDSQVMMTIRLSSYVLFFSFIMYGLFKIIFTTRKVSPNLISVAIVVYLMFGIIGGALALLIKMYHPEAYSLPEQEFPSELLNFTYYSFVTLTTLGYGDIYPLAPESQTLAYLMAIIGQFYIAVIVALLVSKFAAPEADAAENKTEETLK